MKTDTRRSVIWFFLGFLLFIFTRTVTYIAPAIVVAPIFILRFLRAQKAVKGIVLTLLGFTVSLTVSLWGLFSFEDPTFSLLFNTIRSFVIAVVLTLPYIADRLTVKKIEGFASSLIFPTACTAIYYLDATFGPLDGLGIFYAFNQYGNLPLMQLLSVFGIWGLVFLLSWTASVVNWAWDQGFQRDSLKTGLAVFAGVAALVFLYGSARVSPFFYPRGDTVRVAAVTFLPDPQKPAVSIEKLLRQRLYPPFEKTVSTIEKLTGQAAANGAKIVVWQEFAILIPEENLAQFLEAAQRAARENAVFLAISYGVLPRNGKGENRCLLIDDQGRTQIDYLKHNLAVGESHFMKRGPGGLSVVDTPYGRIGVAICRDLEFPAYMREAGRKQADIVLSPAFDFPKGVTPANTYNQMLRAVENGFSLVRAVNNGLSVAVDFHGRILSSMNYFTASNEIMYADVPRKGTRTIYALSGDILPWFCLAAFGWFAVLSIRNKPGSSS